MKKHKTSYKFTLTVQPPESCAQTCKLSVTGACDDELGRTLWLLVAGLQDIIPLVIEAEFAALRAKLEQGIPQGHLAERGRLP